MMKKYFLERKRLWLFTAVVTGIGLWPILSDAKKPSPWFAGRSAAAYRYRLTSSSLTLRGITDLEKNARDRESALAWAELSSAYFRQGKLTGDAAFFDRARDAARNSLAKLPTGNSAKLTLAKIADAQHKFEEAIALGKELMKERPSSEIYPVLVSSYLAKGDLDSAQRVSEEALWLRPESAAYTQHALVLIARGRDEEAAYDFARAAAVEDIGAEEEAARMRALWGRFLLQHGDYVNAGWLFEESLRVQPRNALALGLQGELAARKKDFSGAADKFYEAFELSRQSRYLLRYAQMKKNAGKVDVAAEYFVTVEKLLREDLAKNSSGHRLELVELLLDRGDAASAGEALSLAQKELETRRSGDALVMLARAYFRTERLREAQVAVRAALATGARNPDWYSLAAAIEEKMGDVRRAKFYRGLSVASL